LIVANRTSTTPALLEAVKDRREQSECRFSLLVPAASSGLHRLMNPEDHGQREAEERLEQALPLLSAVAGHAIVGMVGSHEPLAAVEDALNLSGFDEVIISMLPARVSRWLRLDLPSKVRALGVPVTEVIGVDDPPAGQPQAEELEHA
jgi:hypothetical protein